MSNHSLARFYVANLEHRIMVMNSTFITYRCTVVRLDSCVEHAGNSTFTWDIYVAISRGRGFREIDVTSYLNDHGGPKGVQPGEWDELVAEFFLGENQPPPRFFEILQIALDHVVEEQEKQEESND